MASACCEELSFKDFLDSGETGVERGRTIGTHLALVEETPLVSLATGCSAPPELPLQGIALSPRGGSLADASIAAV